MHRTDEFPDWILSGSEAGDNLGNAVADDPGGGLDVGAVVVAEEVTVEDQSPETDDGVEEAARVDGGAEALRRGLLPVRHQPGRARRLLAPRRPRQPHDEQETALPGLEIGFRVPTIFHN